MFLCLALALYEILAREFQTKYSNTKTKTKSKNNKRKLV